MPKQIPQSDLETILKVVSRFPDGVSIEDLLAVPELALLRRSLQRRLALLIDQRRLIVEGQTRNRRYRLAIRDDGRRTNTDPDLGKPAEPVIPLSPAGRSIQRIVRQDLLKRQPVGYSRDFLDSYRPNVSFYLPKDLRQHLMKVGRPLGAELPAGTYVRQIFNRVLIDLTWNPSRSTFSPIPRREDEFARWR